MKNIIIVLFLLTNFTILWGQTNSSSQNEISIHLNKGLSVRTFNGNLDFGGVISSGAAQTLTKLPQNGVTFEVTGTSRNRVSIDYSNNIVLNNDKYVQAKGGTLGNLTFIPNVEETAGFSTYVSPKKIRSGRKIRLSDEGKLFIWVGGEIGVTQNQPTGDYEGTFTITISY